MAGSDLIARYLEAVERAAGGPGRLIEELRDHLEDAAARHLAAGLSGEAAAACAIESCGSCEQLQAAVWTNDESGRRIMAATRWTGLAGIIAVPVAVTGVVFWSIPVYVLTMVLAASAVGGLLACHWRQARWLLSAGLLAFGGGLTVASAFPQGRAPLSLSVGVPAALVLLAVCLAGAAFLRAGIVPRAAVAMTVAGVAIPTGLNTVMYLAGSEPPYLAGLGAGAAIAGWVWMNASLVVRGFQHRAPAAV